MKRISDIGKSVREKVARCVYKDGTPCLIELEAVLTDEEKRYMIGIGACKLLAEKNG